MENEDYKVIIKKVNNHFAKGIWAIEGLEQNSERVTFHCNDGVQIIMLHQVECCEEVYLADDDCITNNTDIYTDCKWCKMSMSQEWDKNDCLWTFYRFQTNKGYDTMRWYGYTDSCYSLNVTLLILPEDLDWNEEY